MRAKVRVTGAQGRKAYLQVKAPKSNKWVTKKSYKLSSTKKTTTVKVKQKVNGGSKWRVYVAPTKLSASGKSVGTKVKATPAYKWSTHNWTQGGQAAVDACRGTVYLDYGSYGKLFAEHNHCGGAWILQIKKGDIIKVTGKQAGLYKAVNSKAVGKAAYASELPAAYTLQTCYFNSNKMRLVGLKKIG